MLTMIHYEKHRHHCLLCGYEWESKKVAPKTCTRCKRYDWNEVKEGAVKTPKEDMVEVIEI